MICFLWSTGIDTLENHKVICFLRSTGFDTLENHKVICFLRSTVIDTLENYKVILFLTLILGSQKNCLTEMVLVSIHNICLGCQIRKMSRDMRFPISWYVPPASLRSACAYMQSDQSLY